MVVLPVVLLAVAVAAEATATLLMVWADDRASETAAAVRTGAEGIVAAEVHRPRPKVLRGKLATAAHAIGRPRPSASEACTWAVAQSAPGQSIQGRRGCRPRSRGGANAGLFGSVLRGLEQALSRRRRRQRNHAPATR